MNPAFNYNFNDIGNSTPPNDGEQPLDNTGAQKNYAQAGYNRNVCFHWLDGRSLFLGYNYLISSELTSDQSKIHLEFTTHIILLSGLCLQELFEDIMHQLVMHIHCIDIRYNSLEKSNTAIVNNISINVKN